ncbi:MAG: recombinase family protein [Lachnospiraceae bacterium]|nr:recombinase family protein [Lachnospiraceae bacterium]
MNRYEILNQERKFVETKKRVAAYCRVSTDKEDQANSLESQQRYFRQYIENNPDWELSEIFADEGISGTSTRKRKEFNRMIACAKQGAFDLIITKEISRFARNTLDSIAYTRELKQYGVGVLFMGDGIHTMDGDAELRLAIMSSIAQEESRKTSERVKWGQRRRMEQGVVFGRSMLGYDVREGKMYVNEEGAEVVRRIFHKFVFEGKGTHVIARELREEGVRPMRVKEWQTTVILRILRNEKYCGDLVQKKTYTPDFLSHEKKYNRGEEEFVILKNHHEPIISRELFDKANDILEKRSLTQKGETKHSKRYPFSGKIKCGCCGGSYVARYKNRKDGSRSKSWRCGKAAKEGLPHTDKAGNQVGCPGPTLRNEDAVHLMRLVTENLPYNKAKITERLQSALWPILREEWAGSEEAASDATKTPSGGAEKVSGTLRVLPGDGDGASVDWQARLLDLYMSGEITKEEFAATKSRWERKARAEQETLFPEKKEETEGNLEKRMKEIKDAMDEILEGTEREETFYRQILEKMVVVDRDRIDIFIRDFPFKWSYLAMDACSGRETFPIA